MSAHGDILGFSVLLIAGVWAAFQLLAMFCSLPRYWYLDGVAAPQEDNWFDLVREWEQDER